MSEVKIRPAQYAVYKSKGAFQVNLLSATLEEYENKEGKKMGRMREGRIFIDAANSIGKQKYDWSKKTTIALDVGDVGKILTGLKQGTETNLIHDKGAKTASAGQHYSSLKIMKGTDQKSYMWNFAIRDKANPDRSVSVSVFTDFAETRVLSELLSSAVPRLLGWAL